MALQSWFRQGARSALIVGARPGDALREVQREMLSDDKTRHPFYWASFVVSGSQAPLDPKLFSAPPKTPPRLPPPQRGCSCHHAGSPADGGALWLLLGAVLLVANRHRCRTP